MSNPCLILEWSDAGSWQVTGTYVGPNLNGTTKKIPAGGQPTVLQPNREIADAEAKRLAAMHPDKRFAVFEAAVVGMTAELPAYVTVAGEVWSMRRVPVLVEIDDSQIPF